jgi:recombination endonuclease VII
VSHGPPDDTPREEYAQKEPPKPRDGRCQICRRFVGVRGLRREHCHVCQLVRGWACDDCNLPFTEHVQENWLAWRGYFDAHICNPGARLFDLPAAPRPTRATTSATRPLHLSNGGGDDRIVNVSLVKGYLSIEQVAAMCGINTATAREQFNGRQYAARPSKRAANGAYLIPIEEAVALLEDRIQRGLQ